MDEEVSCEVVGDDRAEAEGKYRLFGGSYCGELEALWNEVLTEWNSAGDGDWITEFYFLFKGMEYMWTLLG